MVYCSTVSQVDTMACHGLEFLENKWPMIKDDTEKVRCLNFNGKISMIDRRQKSKE